MAPQRPIDGLSNNLQSQNLLHFLKPIHVPPPGSGLNFIYRDDFLVVVNKPAGLLAVPGRGADKYDSLASRVQSEFPDALIVHRLDMSTSGLIVFARGAEVQRRLSRLFREREVHKNYVAVVAGQIKSAVGEISLPLLSDWTNRPRQKVDQTFGKHSLTRYRVLAYDAATDISRVELEPVTGRTHQLRVHLAAIGYPILGDILYGGRAAERLLLHAQSLGFVHPLKDEPLSFVCEPPF